ncbi:hypothetical protein [Paractinoplanes abujensis]|uniref:Uncharacterized protein n=1 Tax=Paractinoplanes abujensis TaxID=882441 RepID=A0A7W7CMB9_9ACTN|nr:hypothetical protein [Actinoplanes abujensis]MBB4691142.1 hypothetical protein [Actinoplanes abujensis]
MFETTVEAADGRVTVVARDGESSSVTIVERRAGAEAAGWVPIGTRSAADLIMTVDGATAALTPGPGGLTRGSYRVTATVAGVVYELKPSSEDDSRLFRGGRRIGEFRRKDDAEVKVWWEDGAAADVRDASVGFALAAAFGTGKMRFLTALLEGGSEGVGQSPVIGP